MTMTAAECPGCSPKWQGEPASHPQPGPGEVCPSCLRPAVPGNTKWADVPDGADPVYFIRFGLPHPRGYSRNHADGKPELGHSAYHAVRVGDDWQLHSSSPRGYLGFCAPGVTPYLVRGVRVSSGSDGEPVIAAVHVVGRLEPSSDDLFGATYRLSR